MKLIFIENAYTGGERLVWYQKPDTALLRNNDPFYLPSFAETFVPRPQLVMKINKVGKAVSEKFAHRYYNEAGVGVEFLPADLRKAAVEQGLPWEMHTAFDHSSAVSLEFPPFGGEGADPADSIVEFAVGDREPLRFSTARLRFSIDRIIAEVSRHMTLKIGDLIYTGCPEETAPLKAGDEISCRLNGRELLKFDIR